MRQQLNKQPWVDECELDLQLFPLQLSVNIRESQPWLVAELNNHSWLVARSGKLLAAVETITDENLVFDVASLPRLVGVNIAGAENAETVSVTSNSLPYALGLLVLYEGAGGFPFQVERFTLLQDGSLQVEPVDSKSYPRALLARAQNMAEAQMVLNNLRGVLADLNERGERAHLVDLRYGGQAVVNLVPEETGEETSSSSGASSAKNQGTGTKTTSLAPKTENKADKEKKQRGV